MTTIVVDTSALYAIVDVDDRNHGRAVEAARDLLDRGRAALTNYVAVETISLVQRRLGMDVARTLQRSAVQRMDILWTTPIEHAAGLEAFLDSGRQLSLVDCATMATMRARALDTIFAFDPDFTRAGFLTVP